MAKQPTVTKIKTMDRSFDGLRSVLFDQLDGLMNGTGKPEVANAVSRVASEITKSVSVQADIMRLAGAKALRGVQVKGMALLK